MAINSITASSAASPLPDDVRVARPVRRTTTHERRLARRRPRPATTGLHAREPHRPRTRRHVLDAGLFRDVLNRERKRADRFDESFVLLLLSLDSELQAGPSAADGGEQPLAPATNYPEKLWPLSIDALTAAVGGRGVVGWFENGAVLGAIVPEMSGPRPETLVWRELDKRIGAAADRLSIQVHTYLPARDQRDPCSMVNPFPADSFLRPEGHPMRRVKRVMDIALSLLLLVLLSPLFLAIAAVLKLTSPGPILFRQRRIGQMARPFTMLKFRTMRANADPALHQEFVTKFIKSSAQLHPLGRKAVFKLTNDPRVTPLGRILRKTSLDELPQFWNVLRGEMSLVGPRPPLPYELEHYKPWHYRRVLEAKPGITGLWQIAGRSRTTYDDMVRLDLRYVQDGSMRTDLKILLATPLAVLSGRGAV
jgi:lipopolysaccharide/colanic/teichoic acid biosynthesis glycosyltransferase